MCTFALRYKSVAHVCVCVCVCVGVWVLVGVGVGVGVGGHCVASDVALLF